MKKSIFLILCILLQTLSPRIPLEYVDPLEMPTKIFAAVCITSGALGKLTESIEKQSDLNQEIFNQSTFSNAMYLISFVSMIGAAVLAAEQ